VEVQILSSALSSFLCSLSPGAAFQEGRSFLRAPPNKKPARNTFRAGGPAREARPHFAAASPWF
ncbi:MAG: hypothetical protein WHZ52_09990, partial [Armatimonadota bacterium]